MLIKKNQLKIEKEEIENKYSTLVEEHKGLKTQIDNFSFENNQKTENQSEFSKKIDELNQETDSLIDEIDKWQM